MYNGEIVSVAGHVVKVEVEGRNTEIILRPTGTLSENLLKHITGAPGEHLRLHLCLDECDQLRSNPNLLHCRLLRKSIAGQENDWEDNVIVADELPRLREAKDRWEEPEKEKEGDDSSSSRKKKKKKAKKKKSKKDRGEIKLKE